MQSIFFISEKPPAQYPKFDQHYFLVPIHFNLTFEKFSRLWHLYSPLAIFTYGDTKNLAVLNVCFTVQRIWVHLQSLPAYLNVAPTVFGSVGTYPDRPDVPLMSVITTTYNSKHKILRPYESLRKQSYTNWEWVVWDDSETPETYETLLKLQLTDLRIKVYRGPRPCGRIGEMKRRACDTAHGSFLIEVDHDDHLHPDLLQWIVDAARLYPDAGFFYTDCCELHEQTFESVSYGDANFGGGTGGHYITWSPMHNTYVTAAAMLTPNHVTVRHLTSLPNHVRAWRTEVYAKAGKHNPLLSVSDDLDLLIRTYMVSKYCHIQACGYFQYRNADGNFTFIRNSLIQHNTMWLRMVHDPKLPPEDLNKRPAPQWQYPTVMYPDDKQFDYDPYGYKETIVLVDPSSAEEVERAWKPDALVVIMGKMVPMKPEKRHNVISWSLQYSNERQLKLAYAKTFFARGESFTDATSP